MSKIISKSDLIPLQASIDLYRSKFKHASTTMFTWNYGGNQEQGWTGERLNTSGTCNVAGKITSPVLTAINTTTYHYLTIKTNMKTPLTIQILDGSNEVVGEFTTSKYVLNTSVCYVDLDGITGWSAGATKITITPDSECQIYYIKIDKQDPFPMINGNVLTDSFGDVLTEEVKVYSNAPETSNGTHTPDSLSEIDTDAGDTIKYDKRAFITNLINTNASKAFNGCSQCDINTCTCNAQVYERTCANADERCSAYQACTCNGTCYNTYTARDCDCDNTRYVVTVPTIQTFNSSAGYTWRPLYSDATLHWRANASQITGRVYELYHGFYNEGGDPVCLNRGFIFFDYNAIRNGIGMNKITKVRLRLTRTDSQHGYPTSASISVAMHNYEPTIWKTLNNPQFLASPGVYDTGTSFTRGETKWVTLPVSFGQAIQNKTAKGLVLYTPDSSNTHYAYFEPPTKNLLNPAQTINGRTYSYIPSVSVIPVLEITLAAPSNSTCTCYMTGYGVTPQHGCNTGYGYVPCATCDTTCNSYACTCDQSIYNNVCRDCHNTKYH